MLERMIECRFYVCDGAITRHEDGKCLLTAAALVHKDEDGNPCPRGMVLMSGVDESAYAAIIEHFGPSLARELGCRLDTMSWMDWQPSGMIVPIRVRWASMSVPEQRVAQAHPILVEWFMNPEDSVRRFCISGGELAKNMLCKHRYNEDEGAVQHAV